VASDPNEDGECSFEIDAYVVGRFIDDRSPLDISFVVLFDTNGNGGLPFCMLRTTFPAMSCRRRLQLRVHWWLTGRPIRA
jgi:hypothetical protein